MLKNESKRKGSCKALLGILALLALVVVLENLNLWLPGVPSLLLPTSQLFVVLKKAAVYSLVAVSMNLLNGFTGLFSLGQAGFMLLGAYTYAILTVPLSVKDQVYYLYGGSAVKFSLLDMFQSIFGAAGFGSGVALVLAVILFSRRMVKARGFRAWQIFLWLLIAIAIAGAGYMEYYVQRRGNEALFAYSVMSGCLLLVIALTLLIRFLAVRVERKYHGTGG